MTYHSFVIENSYVVAIALQFQGEDKHKDAKKLLSYYVGLSNDHISKILDKKATLTGYAGLCNSQNCDICKNKNPTKYEVES